MTAFKEEAGSHSGNVLICDAKTEEEKQETKNRNGDAMLRFLILCWPELQRTWPPHSARR